MSLSIRDNQNPKYHYIFDTRALLKNIQFYIEHKDIYLNIWGSWLWLINKISIFLRSKEKNNQKHTICKCFYFSNQYTLW